MIYIIINFSTEVNFRNNYCDLVLLLLTYFRNYSVTSKLKSYVFDKHSFA